MSRDLAQRVARAVEADPDVRRADAVVGERRWELGTARGAFDTAFAVEQLARAEDALAGLRRRVELRALAEARAVEAREEHAT